MALIYITGSATAGKTTLAGELSKLGYEAYDTEEHGISAWRSKQTDKPVKQPLHMTQKWHSKHLWRISRERIEDFALKAKNKPIILCGIASSEHSPA